MLTSRLNEGRIQHGLRFEGKCLIRNYNLKNIYQGSPV